jgi:hypothetical protein
MQKLDPYLNVDPGTMNPFQHGEVFVTDDGAETDLDIGHYERFLDRNLRHRQRHHRAGLLARHRQGAPRRVPRRHRPGHPAHHQRDQGPHAGDGHRRRPTSSSPRSAAPSATSSRCRSWRPPGRCATRSAATTASSCTSRSCPISRRRGELKTKPTQHSVAALRSIGIQPDALVLRADRPSPRDQAQDLADVRRRPGGRRRCRRRAVDLRHPQGAARRGLDAYVVRRSACPSATSTGPRGTTCSPGPRPRARGRDRPGRQVHRPARRLPVGDRGAARRRLRTTTPRSRSGGSPPTTARPTPRAEGPRRTSTRSSCPAGSACAASRASSARCAGARERQDAHARDLSGPAVHGDRVRPAPAGSSPTPSPSEFDPQTDPPGDRDDGRAVGLRRGRRRPGRHHAPGPVCRPPAPRDGGGRGLRHDRGERASPAPLRGQQRLPRATRAQRDWSSPALPGRGSSSSSSCLPTSTPTTCRPRRTRSSCPARPAHPLFAGLVGAATPSRPRPWTRCPGPEPAP